MTETHYTADNLLEFIETSELSSEIAAHLDACDSCRDLCNSLKHWSAQFSTPALWTSSTQESAQNKPMLEFLRTTAREIEKQQEQAQASVDALIAGGDGGWTVQTAPDDLRTCGGVRVLLERAREERKTSPSRSLLIAGLASDLAAGLPDGAYPSTILLELRGTSLKEKSSALRLLGRYSEALEELESAARYFAQMPAGDFELAIIDYARSLILRELDEPLEALRYARSSARSFLEYGDVRRYNHARYVEGAILHGRGEVGVARDIFLSILPDVRAEGDLPTLAILFNALGQCHVDLGDPNRASQAFLQALSLYGELGMTVERVRTEWGLARLLGSTGHSPQAIEKLHRVREQFASLGMSDNAALVSLDIAELLLSQGNPREAGLVCQGLVETFTSSGSSANAVRALSYLRECSAAGLATQQLVREVRSYLERLPQEPRLLFLTDESL